MWLMCYRYTYVFVWRHLRLGKTASKRRLEACLGSRLFLFLDWFSLDLSGWQAARENYKAACQAAFGEATWVDISALGFSFRV